MSQPSIGSPSRTGLAIDVAVKAATIGLLAWAIANPELPQFQGKAFTGRAVAYPIALLIVPVAWWLLARRRIPFSVLPDILIGLPFLIDVAGNALNLYDSLEWWDDANHLVNWGLHTAGVGLLLRYGSASPGFRIALAFEWAVTSAVLWEFAEYVAFVPGSPEAATAYADTLGDIALGMVGGLIAAIVTSRLPLLREGKTAPAEPDAAPVPAGP
ncbi:MAG TPA: hypothetical protein VEX41_11270 [Candidatus Eisenbacteria bacterium]|nr:hypothetical protein [Candidatus Eisenbacteria bacterium]